MASLASVPQWSRDMKSFRSSLKLSQCELGKRLNCSAMAVSRWERGEQPPSAGHYLAVAKIASPFFGWTFWNLAGITEDDVQRMPTLKAKTKKRLHHLSTAITVLEIEVARSGERAARRDALFPDLPTRAVRREYKTIATAEANFARVVAYHIQMLKSFAV
jgi:transcriptional regulator with XRE-family HTH domain